MSDNKEPQESKDTGHEWDGIRELDNPLPRWWVLSLWASLIAVVIYCILYPSVPLIHGNTKGVLGWTQIKEYKENMAEIEAVRAPYEAKLQEMTATQILDDTELSTFTQSSVSALFGNRCAPCHGAGGQGGPGFPVLADDDWLYGGTVDTIQETITYGRQGNMPAHASFLSAKEIDDVVRYVSGLSMGNVYPAGKAVFNGETEGAAACSGCHGEDGRGMQMMGSANLTDGIWRFSGTEEGIRYTIMHGVNDDSDSKTRKATMPAFEERLTETQIKKLAILVHQFGGGERE